MCVSKTLSTLGLREWTHVDIDDVAFHQMPSIFKFIARLGLTNADRLQHISFPYTASSLVRVPGKAQMYNMLVCLFNCGELVIQMRSISVCFCRGHNWVACDVLKLPWLYCGWLVHSRILSLWDRFTVVMLQATWIINTSKPWPLWTLVSRHQRGAKKKFYGWALCPNEIQNLITLNNLSKLVSVICLILYCEGRHGSLSTYESFWGVQLCITHVQQICQPCSLSIILCLLLQTFPTNFRLMNSLLFVCFTDLSKCCWMISMTLQCCGRPGKSNPSNLVRDLSLFGSVGSGTAIAWLIDIEDFEYERP